MKVIDARTGRELKIGDYVQYGGGEWLRLIDVDEGLFSASATIETGSMGVVRDSGGHVVGRRQIVPLSVRFMHPKFLFQKVAFIPS